MWTTRLSACRVPALALAAAVYARVGDQHLHLCFALAALCLWTAAALVALVFQEPKAGRACKEGQSATPPSVIGAVQAYLATLSTSMKHSLAHPTLRFYLLLNLVTPPMSFTMWVASCCLV